MVFIMIKGFNHLVAAQQVGGGFDETKQFLVLDGKWRFPHDRVPISQVVDVVIVADPKHFTPAESAKFERFQRQWDDLVDLFGAR